MGVAASYISMLERGTNDPSGPLLLSICREFGVRIEWLRDGKGAMWDQTPRISAKGGVLIEEIIRRLNSADRKVALSDIAVILGLDPKNVPQDLPLAEDFPRLIAWIVKIYWEGNTRQINAVRALFKALGPTDEEIREKARKALEESGA